MAADTMKEVLSSESSKRDASGIKDKRSLQVALGQLKEEFHSNKNRIAQIELRLSQLTRTVQGRRMPTGEYADLCDEQISLKGELIKLRTRQCDLKIQNHAIEADLGREDKVDRLVETNSLLREILLELKRMRLVTAPPAP